MFKPFQINDPLPPPSVLVSHFARHYDAVIRNTGQRYRRYTRPVNYFVDPLNADIMSTSIANHVTSINVVSVEIPEDRLEKLIELDYQVRVSGGSSALLNWAEDLFARNALEDRIRKSNPAVKKAYENYSMLLNLVKDEYK